MRSSRLLFATLMILWGALGPAARAARAQSSFTDKTMIAFTPLEAFDRDQGRTAARLGMSPGAIYLFGALRPYGDTLRTEQPIEATSVRLAPNGLWIAFAGSAGPSPWDHLPGVFVADTSGAIVARFPGAKRFAWNESGNRLAVAYGRADSGQLVGVRGVSVWDAATRRVRQFPPWPASVGWGARDSLYLGFGDHVEALDLPSGNVRWTRHHSVDVSPDGRYSLVPGGPAGYRLFDDETGIQCFGCLVERMGSTRRPDVHAASWIRSPGAGHLVCISLCGDGAASAGGDPGSGCRSGVVDARTGELWAVFPGRLLGITLDQRGLVVLKRDENLGIDDAYPELAPRRDGWTDRRAPKARVHVEADLPSDRRSEPARRRTADATYTVGLNDWIPVDQPANASCGWVFQVTGIYGKGRVRVAFDRDHWTVKAIGGRSVAPADTAGGEVIVMREGVLLQAIPPDRIPGSPKLGMEYIREPTREALQTEVRLSAEP